MKKKKSSVINSGNNSTINVVIMIGVVFLIGALIFMFVNNGSENHIKTINYNEYLDVIKEDKYSIILLTNPSCSHCNSYKPFVNYVASEYNLDVYNIDLTTITYEQYKELHDRYSATKEYYSDDNELIIPTPATIIVKNNIEIASILGDIGHDGLVKLLKNNQVIQ